MAAALTEARAAAGSGEVPVGAVVVARNRIVGRGRNQTEALHDVTAHAEIIALTAASQYFGSKFLRTCTLYVTLEPCLMCAGALYWAQLGRLVYAAADPLRGYRRVGTPVLHPRTQVCTGVCGDEAEILLSGFFAKLRQ